MTDLLPLVLIWAYANRSQASLSRNGGAPSWPTTKSPPPSIPAFDAVRTDPYATHSADPSQSSTPLAELHNAPPPIPDTVKNSDSIPEQIKQHAVQSFKRKATSALTQAANDKTREYAKKHAISVPNTKGPTLNPRSKPSPATRAANLNARNYAKSHAMPVANTRGPTLLNDTTTTTLPVVKIQQILNNYGAKLKPDGLFGPKTQNAWRSVANKKHLAPTITRDSAKSAKVVTHTYEVLSVPPIP